MFMIKGVVPPLVTPIDEHENVDKDALVNLIEHVIKGGVHGIFVLGSTGEFYGLSYEEKVRAIEITMEQVNGRVPVYIGANAITTKECVQLTRLAKQYKAAAVTVLTPMFISPNDSELYTHFRTISEAEDIPIVLYNNPERTGVSLSAELVEKLADIPNIVGAKDTSGDMTLTSEYIRRTQDKEFSVMAGKDTLILATLVYGGTGCVAGTANIVPRLVVDIYDKFISGDLHGALEAQYRLSQLRMAYNLGSFPVVVKDALNLIGVDTGQPVRPIQQLSNINKEKLRNILNDIGAIN